jgi:plasmid stabilization system protein ParE
MEYEDLTPTWETAAEIYILALEHGTEAGKAAAREEIRRLARNYDQLVEELKGTEA